MYLVYYIRPDLLDWRSDLSFVSPFHTHAHALMLGKISNQESFDVVTVSVVPISRAGETSGSSKVDDFIAQTDSGCLSCALNRILWYVCCGE